MHTQHPQSEHPQHPPIFDVIIAGGGPVGLFLACELRLFGLSVLVLEQAADTHTPLKRLPFGLRGLSVPTQEALYRRDLLDTVRAAQHSPATRQAAHWLQQPRQPAGHFAGIQFYQDDIDRSQWPLRLPDAMEGSLPVALESFETALAQRAQTLGAEIRYGMGVSGLKANDDGVAVTAGAAHFNGRWLVGCDGGRSTVRKLGGFQFTGTEPEFTGYSAEVELADPNALPPGRHYTANGMYTFARPGTLALVDFDGGAFHRTTPITLHQVQTVLQRVSGTDIQLTALKLASTWTDRAFQASSYRHGRVLLAGDAAHVHSPLGGQGLNLGIGDAMNLGWKLAATVRGDAPAALLDSYQQERHPVGAAVLDWSRAQVALMRPTPATRALAAVMRDLIETRDGATYFAERVWGVSLRYPLGDGHPLVGRSVPDFELSNGARVGTLLRGGQGLLLQFDSSPSLAPQLAPWQRQVSYVAGAVQQNLGLRALLVRPDGVAAWATDDLADTTALAAALARWFGPQHS
ncbi:FAD-dependent monooxygenase [Amantichitinum ursilacus]|uniref:Pentachlorophenol 4-monooxygenase n=1 Tax=Amantichitinum ursilacus TaxID=857265 RepID=A0A0N0XJC4_9NEIS|nr:FAD-dependent monooxygenase [Amantichitinum ursilacus]KPC52057.1 Pentachlorophenol 4-monooxygenase [Amantichitinum ursilacus]